MFWKQYNTTRIISESSELLVPKELHTKRENTITGTLIWELDHRLKSPKKAVLNNLEVLASYKKPFQRIKTLK